MALCDLCNERLLSRHLTGRRSFSRDPSKTDKLTISPGIIFTIALLQYYYYYTRRRRSTVATLHLESAWISVGVEWSLCGQSAPEAKSNRSRKQRLNDSTIQTVSSETGNEKAGDLVDENSDHAVPRAVVLIAVLIVPNGLYLVRESDVIGDHLG